MSQDYREAFYERRFQRLAKDVPRFRPDITRAIVSLAWLHDAMSRQFNLRLSQYELTTASFNLLAILQELGEAPLHELGRLLVKTAANVTGLVDGLVKRGLVQRVAHPQDRRVKLARLTPAGEKLIAEVLPQHHSSACELFGVLNPLELESLTAMARRLMMNLPDEGNA